MSTKVLHIIEAIGDHEAHAPELGSVRLQDLLQHSFPLDLRADINIGWQQILAIDMASPRVQALPEVAKTREKFDVINRHVTDHLLKSEHLTVEERTRLLDVWYEDGLKISTIAGRLSILGSYLRDTKGIYTIGANDRFKCHHTFKLGSYICIKIGINTFTSTVMDKLQDDPGNIALSPQAKASKRAAKGGARTEPKTTTD